MSERCKNCPLKNAGLWAVLPFGPVTADYLPLNVEHLVIDASNCPGPTPTGETEKDFLGRNKQVMQCQAVSVR